MILKHKAMSMTRIQAIYLIKSTNKITHMLEIFYHAVMLIFCHIVMKKHKK